MLEVIAAFGAGIAVGYVFGSPTEMERTVEKHIETPRVDISGSVHGRGEASVESIETEEMEVVGSVHDRGTVNVDE